MLFATLFLLFLSVLFAFGNLIIRILEFNKPK